MLISPTVHLLIDQFSAYEAAKQNRVKTDPAKTAEVLGMAASLLGPINDRFAIIEENDRESWEAFTKANFQVRSMNGDRPQAIYEVIEKMRHDLQGDHPKYLVAVTDDLAFHQLFQDARRYNTELRVFVPGRDIPSLFTRGGYDVRLLNEIIPEPKPTRYDVRIDFENVWIGLKRNGFVISPKQVIEAIKQKAADMGDVGTITAYADWDLLSRDSQYNLQRELALISGVETRYQPNESGKNSADMVIADHIRTAIERPSSAPDAVDVVILCTGDRDFRQVVDTVKGRNKKVILFAVKDTLSRELKQAADKVFYLDDLPPITTGGKRLKSTDLPKPNHPQAERLMKFLAFLQRRRWEFAFANRLASDLGPDAEAQLHKAVAARLLTEQDGKFSPNYQHPQVQASQQLLKWVSWRIRAVKKQRGFNEVDASFLIKEMQKDGRLSKWQIGKSWDEATAWLELIAKTGLIHQGTRPNPHKSGQTIITWSLFSQSTKGSAEGKTKPDPKKPDEPSPTPPSGKTEIPSHPPNSDKSSSVEAAAKRANIQPTLKPLCRRLAILEERAALQGTSADPSLIIEIEDLKEQIKQLESQM